MGWGPKVGCWNCSWPEPLEDNTEVFPLLSPVGVADGRTTGLRHQVDALKSTPPRLQQRVGHTGQSGCRGDIGY